MSELNRIKDQPHNTQPAVRAPENKFNHLPAAAAALVLIGEAHSDTGALFEHLFASWGFQSVRVATGEAVVRAATAIRFDLILMDVILPVVDGLSAAGRIRELESGAPVPIVFASTLTDQKYRDDAIACGGSEYLVKPLDFGLLKNVCDRYLNPSARLSPPKLCQHR